MTPLPGRWIDRVAAAVPKPLRRRLVRMLASPRVGSVNFGDLRSMEPISRSWGAERGTPVDRVFIEDFLHGQRHLVRGRVLEFGSPVYARRFGDGRVRETDVFDVDPQNPMATVVGDLATSSDLPDGRFDCILCIQTLQFVADLPRAFHVLHRMLRPGGVLLATVPGIAQVTEGPANPWTDYWRLTPASVELLAKSAFPRKAGRSVKCYGNVLTATAFLQGIASEELEPSVFALHDPSYPVIVTLTATRGEGAG